MCQGCLRRLRSAARSSAQSCAQTLHVLGGSHAPALRARGAGHRLHAARASRVGPTRRAGQRRHRAEPVRDRHRLLHLQPRPRRQGRRHLHAGTSPARPARASVRRRPGRQRRRAGRWCRIAAGRTALCSAGICRAAAPACTCAALLRADGRGRPHGGSAGRGRAGGLGTHTGGAPRRARRATCTTASST